MPSRPFWPGRRRRRYSIMTTARWEAPYIGEWLAYHRELGFDHVYLYCNDDEPSELHDAVAGWTEGPDPFLTFVHCPHQGQQWWMFIHFLQTYRDATEWVAFLDLDEFLSLRRDPDLHAFMRRRPADADCIYFHWTLFGHMGFAERPAGSVLRRYTRRQAGLSSWTKTLTRTARIDPRLLRPELRHNIVYPHHGWDRKFSTPGLRSYDVLGGDMSDYWPDHEAGFAARFADPRRVEQVFEEAVVHHYAFRSLADFNRRLERGLGGDFAGQAMWSGGAENCAGFLAGLDRVEDRTLADWWERRSSRRAAELGMYPAPPAPLVSRGRPCLQSSVWTPDGSVIDAATQAGRAVDGRALDGGYAFHTDAEPHPWWQVDLQSPHRIVEVRLYNRMAGADRAEKVRISLSDDGIRWRCVHARNEAGSFGGADGRPLRWRPQRPELGRFVRVETPGGVLHLEQVEVFGRLEGGPSQAAPESL